MGTAVDLLACRELPRRRDAVAPYEVAADGRGGVEICCVVIDHERLERRVHRRAKSGHRPDHQLERRVAGRPFVERIEIECTRPSNRLPRRPLPRSRARWRPSTGGDPHLAAARRDAARPRATPSRHRSRSCGSGSSRARSRTAPESATASGDVSRGRAPARAVRRGSASRDSAEITQAGSPSRLTCSEAGRARSVARARTRSTRGDRRRRRTVARRAGATASR